MHFPSCHDITIHIDQVLRHHPETVLPRFNIAEGAYFEILKFPFMKRLYDNSWFWFDSMNLSGGELKQFSSEPGPLCDCIGVVDRDHQQDC